MWGWHAILGNGDGHGKDINDGNPGRYAPPCRKATRSCDSSWPTSLGLAHEMTLLILLLLPVSKRLMIWGRTCTEEFGKGRGIGERSLVHELVP